jgi:hypothetical protein
MMPGPGHDGVTGQCELGSKLACHFVVTVSRSKPGGAEDGDAGPIIIAEEFEAAKKFEENAHGAFQIFATVSAAG